MTPTPPAAGRPRDLRLDFFRGSAMFIILLAHTPGNPWTLWIPARFGFSDATEIFVFCSGMASAIAFGSVFERAGWAMGTARVAFRCWQVYWAHVGLFLAVAALTVVFNGLDLGTRDYVGQLNLYPFFETDTMRQLVGLLTLTYVPNYFDILPMYLVVLVMIPLVMAAAAIDRRAVAVLVLGVWLGAQSGLLWLPAEPWSDREWFFNPFGWQLVFFTGFAFGRGWIAPPPVTRWLVLLAVAVVLLSLPLEHFRVLQAFAPAREARAALEAVGLVGKTDFAFLRYAHFLALAYLAWAAVGPGGVRLSSAGALQPVVNQIRKVGTQSLAVFMTSLVVAQTLAMLADVSGAGAGVWLVLNAAGFAALIATAHAVSWFKRQPWRAAGAAARAEASRAGAPFPHADAPRAPAPGAIGERRAVSQGGD